MEFDISNVYGALSANAVKIGSKGYYADNLETLKLRVSDEASKSYGMITEILGEDCLYRFRINGAWDRAFFYLIEEPEPEAKTKVKSLSLNEIAKLSYENAKKREANGGHISAETRSMLKHCATEVIEAAEAYSEWTDVDCGAEGVNFPTQTEAKRAFAMELADIICCCTIIAGRENIDLDKAVADCLGKNRKRAEGIGDKL